MEWLSSLQEAINYIEENLLDDINYEDVAKQVYMSSYNFHRTFSLMTGITANEYIRNRRLSLAGQELQSSHISVIDVALKFGYETPESFSKAFTRFHGVSPKMAKRNGNPLRLFNPLKIKITIEGGIVMEYRIEHLESQRFITLTESFSNEIMGDDNNQSIPDFWGRCHHQNLITPIRNLRPDGKKDLYGLCCPTKENETHFNYGIGVIIDDETDISSLESLCENGFSIWETFPTDYVVIKCYGKNGDCISDAWSRYYSEFLPQTNYSQTELTDFEIYFENGEDNLFCELWIPVIKK